MKFILIIMTLTLTACMYQTVNENDWRLGSEFCKSKNSEILQIEANTFGGEHYLCKNSEHMNSK